MAETHYVRLSLPFDELIMQTARELALPGRLLYAESMPAVTNYSEFPEQNYYYVHGPDRYEVLGTMRLFWVMESVLKELGATILFDEFFLYPNRQVATVKLATEDPLIVDTLTLTAHTNPTSFDVTLSYSRMIPVTAKEELGVIHSTIFHKGQYAQVATAIIREFLPLVLIGWIEG